jgi:hypothetical protein
MTDWLEMTEAQREAANEDAYCGACDRLRSMQARYPLSDMATIRAFAFGELALDVKENTRLIKRGERARATKADKRAADTARQSSARLALVGGFIWDAEI